MDIEELLKYESTELRNDTDRSEIKKTIDGTIEELEDKLVKLKRLLQLEAMYDIDFYKMSVEQIFEKNERPFLSPAVRFNQNSVSLFWQKARVFNNPKTGKKQVINNYIKMRNKDGYSITDFSREDPQTKVLAMQVEDNFKVMRKGLKQLSEIKTEIQKLKTILKKGNLE